MSKYTNNSNQFHRDCIAGSTFIESYEKDCPDAKVFADILYALGCKFSEEGTTSRQDELLRRVASALRGATEIRDGNW